ncbi:terpene cyclase/mutase family protein [Vicingaceae bacterium]|nr:terpene cyclase/mutase family protein [Vicingaceae bacterium]
MKTGLTVSILALIGFVFANGFANRSQTISDTTVRQDEVKKRDTDSGTVQEPSDSQVVAVDKAKLEMTTRKAVDFLRAHQAQDGSWDSQLGIGVTGLVTISLLQNGVPPTDPVLQKSLKYLQSHVKPSGGIHKEGTFYRNYETSIAIQCFAQADKMSKVPKYQRMLNDAGVFMKSIQWKKGEGIEDSDPRIGGAGYGKHNRPDLSNTSMFIDALKALDTDDNDPAMQAAIKFVSRSQNLESSHNTTPHGAKINDGGFYYTPAGEGESKAEKTANGGLRSYGSMTYAGFKSLLYAGVDKNDIRVQAASDWISKHYDLDANPGMGQQGLYYYYHIFAKALDAYGENVFIDGEGKKHNWRAELVEVLASKQLKDGSWTNEADRWYEGSPNLCAAYCLLALSYCTEK